jgi:hypothetical protein
MAKYSLQIAECHINKSTDFSCTNVLFVEVVNHPESVIKSFLSGFFVPL